MDWDNHQHVVQIEDADHMWAVLAAVEDASVNIAKELGYEILAHTWINSEGGEFHRRSHNDVGSVAAGRRQASVTGLDRLYWVQLNVDQLPDDWPWDPNEPIPPTEPWIGAATYSIPGQVNITVSGEGANTIKTHGVFGRLKAAAAEIPAPTKIITEKHEPTPVENTKAVQKPGNRRQRVWAILNQNLISQILGALGAAAIIALVGYLLVVLR